jgi:hypothetical protein
MRPMNGYVCVKREEAGDPPGIYARDRVFIGTKRRKAQYYKRQRLYKKVLQYLGLRYRTKKSLETLEDIEDIGSPSCRRACVTPKTAA